MTNIERVFDDFSRRHSGYGAVTTRDDAPTLAPVSSSWDDSERAALIALLRTRPDRKTWPQIMGEVDSRGSAVALWNEANPADLFEGPAQHRALIEAQEDLGKWEGSGLGFLTFLDESYPAQLREIHDLPPVLFYRGSLVPGDIGMSVVGSRAASEQGLRIARTVASALVERGITVLAGLARGIDTAAHIATLDAGGRTVAVIGTGINRAYPAENRALQDRLFDEGLVLSQFWPDAPPTKHSFPMRNIVMSGYGRATIVVEAGEHSGARIQAKRAVAHGRPVILTDLVVNANSWPAEMIGKPGVYVARSTAEVMRAVEAIISGPDRIDALLAAAATT